MESVNIERELKNALLELENEKEGYDLIEIETECEVFYLWLKANLIQKYYDYYIEECSWGLEELKESKELEDTKKVQECKDMLDELISNKQKHQKSPFNFILSERYGCEYERTDIQEYGFMCKIAEHTDDSIYEAITKEEAFELVKSKIGFAKIVKMEITYDNSHMSNFAESYFF
ncbi:hypothetical protein [Bacillus anthracis]|uniref:hypothetical protein n=1 Tax=Bacillus TaxID=1386 RepID=UPI003B97FA57|nr:hypothetical protein [Bacillus cereus]